MNFKILLIALFFLSVGNAQLINPYAKVNGDALNFILKNPDNEINYRIAHIKGDTSGNTVYKNFRGESYSVDAIQTGCLDPSKKSGAYFTKDSHLDWSNTKMSKEYLDNLVDDTLSLVDENFKNSLQKNPAFAHEMREKIEKIRNSSSCLNENNFCRIELYSTVEHYSKYLSPEIELFEAPGKDPCEKYKQKNDRKKMAQTKCLEYDKKLVEYQKAVAYSKLTDELPSLMNEWQINKNDDEKVDALILNELKKMEPRMPADILRKEYLGFLNQRDEQIGQQKKDFFYKLDRLVNPQEGCCHRIVNGKEQKDFRGTGKCLAIYNLESSKGTEILAANSLKDNFDNSCVVEDKIAFTKPVQGNFDTQSSIMMTSEIERIKETLKQIFEENDAKSEDERVQITAVEIRSTSSKSWSTQKDDKSAYSSNLKLANDRKKYMDSNLALFRQVPGMESISLITSASVIGPSYEQSKDLPLKNQAVNDESLGKLYDAALKEGGPNPYIDIGIFSKEDYIKKAKELEAKNLYDAKFKPFQGVTVIVKGYTQNEIPCSEYEKRMKEGNKMAPLGGIKPEEAQGSGSFKE